MKKGIFRKILPLLLIGVILGLSPFLIKVKLASDNGDNGNSQEDPQSNEPVRSATNDGYYSQGVPTSSTYTFYYYFSDDYLNKSFNLNYFSNYSILAVNNRGGSYAPSNIYGFYVYVDANYNLKYGYQSNDIGILLSYDDIEKGACISFESTYSSGSLSFVCRYSTFDSFTDTFDNVILLTYTDLSSYNYVAFRFGMMPFKYTKTSFSIDNLIGYSVPQPVSLNENYLKINNNYRNYVFVKEFVEVWNTTSLTASTQLLYVLNDVGGAYEISLFPNYYGLSKGLIRITYISLNDSSETVLYDLDYNQNNFLILLIDRTNDSCYFDCSVMRSQLTNDRTAIVYRIDDEELDISDFVTSDEIIDSISYQSCLISNFNTTEGISANAAAQQNLSNFSTIFYAIGYEAGFNGESAISPFIKLASDVFGGIDDVLQIQIVPHIKLWYFIAIPLVFCVIWGVLKIWRHN